MKNDDKEMKDEAKKDWKEDKMKMKKDGVMDMDEKMEAMDDDK